MLIVYDEQIIRLGWLLIQKFDPSNLNKIVVSITTINDKV